MRRRLVSELSSLCTVHARFERVGMQLGVGKITGLLSGRNRIMLDLWPRWIIPGIPVPYFLPVANNFILQILILSPPKRPPHRLAWFPARNQATHTHKWSHGWPLVQRTVWNCIIPYTTLGWYISSVMKLMFAPLSSLVDMHVLWCSHCSHCIRVVGWWWSPFKANTSFCCWQDVPQTAAIPTILITHHRSEFLLTNKYEVWILEVVAHLT